MWTDLTVADLQCISCLGLSSFLSSGCLHLEASAQSHQSAPLLSCPCTDTELLAPLLCADSESTPWKVTTLKFLDKKKKFNISPHPPQNVYKIHFELFCCDLPLLVTKLFLKCSNSPEKEEFRRGLKMYDKDKAPLTFPQKIRIAADASDDFQNECAEIPSFQWHYFITV